jgi:hypothetical protein
MTITPPALSLHLSFHATQPPSFLRVPLCPLLGLLLPPCSIDLILVGLEHAEAHRAVIWWRVIADVGVVDFGGEVDGGWFEGVVDRER